MIGGMMTKDEATSFMELLNKKEELDPELQPYLVDGKHWKALKHPLIFDVPYFEEKNALTNYQYRMKKEQLNKAIEDKEYSLVTALYERPYRVNAFREVESKLSDREYWETLSWLWSDSENIWQNLGLWKKFLRSSRKEREFFMDEEEREFLAKLPEQVTVYRGYEHGKNLNGLSYTLDKARAEWFAKRYTKTNGRVRERVVFKKDIFAYLNGRNEQEVIIL